MKKNRFGCIINNYLNKIGVYGMKKSQQNLTVFMFLLFTVLAHSKDPCRFSETVSDGFGETTIGNSITVERLGLFIINGKKFITFKVASRGAHKDLLCPAGHAIKVAFDDGSILEFKTTESTDGYLQGNGRGSVFTMYKFKIPITVEVLEKFAKVTAKATKTEINKAAIVKQIEKKDKKLLQGVAQCLLSK